MSKETLSLSKPSQPILVSTKGTFEIMGRKKEIDNLITLAWHMPASYDPPLYIIGLGNKQF